MTLSLSSSHVKIRWGPKATSSQYVHYKYLSPIPYPKFLSLDFVCENMAAFFGSPQFLSLPKTRSNYFSSSQTPPPEPPSYQLPEPPTTPPKTQQLSSNAAEPPSPTVAKVQQQKPVTKTSVESTDWIASTLTRRFGIGAGLAWVGFLAVGVLSEQIKTRFEVSQQEANTRYDIY